MFHLPTDTSLTHTQKSSETSPDFDALLSKITLAIREKNVACPELLTFVMSHHTMSPTHSLPIEVLWQIYHASHAHITPENWIEMGPRFGYRHLNNTNLIQLYQILQAYHTTSDDKSIFFSHIFDIRDELFRRSVCSSITASTILDYVQSLHDPILESLEQKLCALHAAEGKFQPIFHPLIKKSEVVAGRCWDDYRIMSRTRSSKGPIKLKVAKVSLETSSNIVGGLGTVLKASAMAHHTLNYERVVGIHAFYTHDKARKDAKFKGIILHEFDGRMVESSVYKDVLTGDYLIMPSSEYRSLFDVKSSNEVYSRHTYSSLQERNLFLASASAAIVSLYCGKEGNKAFHVVQGDGFHVAGPLFELMATRIDHMVEQAGLFRSARIALTHMLVPYEEEQGLMPSRLLSRIGANIDSYGPYVNATASSLIHSDARLFVSKGVREDALSEDSARHANLLTALLTPGRETVFRGITDVHGLTNGIDTSVFDITNTKYFGDFSLRETVMVDAADPDEPLDFVKHQAKIKAVLAEHGLIADKDKPLFLFVGRFSSEKGIDMLPGLAEAVIKQGGQCVIMGLKCQDPTATAIIGSLKKASTTFPFNGLLKVYDDRADQLDTFTIDGRDTGAKKGWLLRASASVVMVPSHAEACGLVPMEAHCTGALIIAPNHQGLRDMCIPLAYDSSTRSRGHFDGGNTFMYEDHRDKMGAIEAVHQAMMFLLNTSQHDLNQYMRLTHDYAVHTYGWLNLDAEGRPQSGTTMNYSAIYHDVYHRLHRGRATNVENFLQAVERTKRTQLLDSVVAATTTTSSCEPIDPTTPPIESTHLLDSTTTETTATGSSEPTASPSPDHATRLRELGVLDEYQNLLDTATFLSGDAFSVEEITNGLADLYFKVFDRSVLSSGVEKRLAVDAFFTEAQKLLSALQGIICEKPMTTLKQLAYLQLVQTGGLCGVGILDNLKSCKLLLESRSAETLEEFVHNAFENFYETSFESLYQVFLAGRPDSSHPRVALRAIFDTLRSIKTPVSDSPASETSNSAPYEPALTDIVLHDVFLDLLTFPEFRTQEDMLQVKRWLKNRFTPDTFLPLFTSMIETNATQRELLIDWFTSHVPHDFTPTLTTDEDMELSTLVGSDRKDFISYHYLLEVVYDKDYRIRPTAIADMIDKLSNGRINPYDI